ncbi:MAG: hypothetical protein EHM15_10100 [Desulfobacteraceae bacterium]|nr:MAG: hypothetical protein EHM15_10100 [Desulfobacteraceae bacterium]
MTITPNGRHLSAHLHIGCFGNFRIEDRVCRNHCAIRIRCAIERDQSNFLEVIDEMEAADEGYFLKSK